VFFLFFYFHDVDLDPMTLIYELKNFPKMDFLGQLLYDKQTSKQASKQTDRRLQNYITYNAAALAVRHYSFDITGLWSRQNN